MKKIILLAMSTLRTSEDKQFFVVNESNFVYEETKEINNCRGQLEPIVKLLIDESQLDKDNVEIIILYTNETKNQKKFVKFKGEKDGEAEYSSLDYFKYRIDNYIKEDKGYDLSCRTYKEINIDENFVLDGIKDAIAHIRTLYNGSNEDKIEFWIDTHGGFRDISLVINAIISVLRIENEEYLPKKILGVKYDGSVSKIVDQKYAFDILKFVSGMEAFSKYGNADILVEYFDNEKSLKKNNKCEETAKSMKEVSKGMKECNPNAYVDGLNRLRRNIVEFNDEDSSLMGIFKDYIVADYDDLIKVNQDVLALAVIKRCVKKQMYQQALTLIESLMPEFYMKNKILYIKDMTDEEVSQIEQCKRQAKKAHLGIEHFVFDQYVCTQPYSEDRFNNKLSKFMKGTCRNFNTHFVGRDSKEIVYLDRDKSYFVAMYTDLPGSTYGKAGKLMRMHKALKDTRNRFNHCNPDRPEMEFVISMMEEYVEIVETLVDSLNDNKR